jgi:hypothetical protein
MIFDEFINNLFLKIFVPDPLIIFLSIRADFRTNSEIVAPLHHLLGEEAMLNVSSFFDINCQTMCEVVFVLIHSKFQGFEILTLESVGYFILVLSKRPWNSMRMTFF